MLDARLRELIAEKTVVLLETRRLLALNRRLAREMRLPAAEKPPTGNLVLLMAEGLIAAHMAAKADGDGATLDVIEAALVHVGRRLAKEA